MENDTPPEETRRGPDTIPESTLHRAYEDSDEEATWVVDMEQDPLHPMGFGERYVRDRRLGEGGMGEVILCQDRRIGRRVALKVLHQGSEASDRAQGRFLREARIQGQLEHPSVVPVYDIGVDPGGGVYFTMKRVLGRTLEEILDDHRDDPEGLGESYSRRKLLTAFGSVCLAVDFAHQHGVLHRDIKPSNVMLGDFGEVYLLDWGLARLAETVDTEQPKETRIDVAAPLEPKTMTGAIMGTPGYMPPEQMRGQLQAMGPCSEVYSLGAILFELLTLQELHRRGSPADLVASTLGGVEARPSARAPHMKVPPELESIVVRATALNPGDRYASARGLYEAIERFLDGERDDAERRRIANRHAETAWASAHREGAGRGPGEDSLAARRLAMREVGRALALDPGNQLALSTMVHLMSNPPEVSPPEVEQEMRASSSSQIRQVARMAGFAYLTLLLYLPFFTWLGVHSPASVGVFYAFSLAAAFLSFGTSIPERPPEIGLWATMVTSQLAMASSVTLFGPLIVTPTLLAVNTTAFAIITDGWKRVLPVALGVGLMLLLVALHQGGFLPGGYAFTDTAGMTVLPGAVKLPETATLTFLTLIAVSAIIISSATVAAARDALRKAQRKLYLYTWHLREVLPEQARSGDGEEARGRRMTFRASGSR